ncbi:zinc finger protein BRUTUS-like At1g18910 isoform X1 [Ziziphus jujuba]|uniref:Zinc finger protein BRUTUS-like At1g18910 isoform X1 n=1 Tax=Ziziphus jujuba TaxID=326968 RepID=A0ABM3IK12_ZIZJJ|nr:zinc finger protein BRUTUS-like At1g18910 isoform X1 [Ziziphus jujuba]
MAGTDDHSSSSICHQQNLTVPAATEEEEEEMATSTSQSSSSPLLLPLAENPILFLVCFHMALRSELDQLRRLATEAFDTGLFYHDFAVELLRRFDFLKLAYKYHCAAEDEVIFHALDDHVPNVASTYTLEHRSIDGLFDSIFYRLNVIMEENENENVSKPYQELVFCIGTLHTFISQHMLKEEEQVFPLLSKQFSPKKQAAFVWQFLCSIPVMLLEDLLPWTISFLPLDEQLEVKNCIKEIVPEEKSLQEVVIYWLSSNNQHPLGSYSKSGTDRCLEGSTDMKVLLKSQCVKRYLGENWSCIQAYPVQEDVGQNLVDGLHIWHGAIRKDFIEILEELYQSRSSSNFSNLDTIILQLKFLADVLTFYSIALGKLFYPVLNKLVDGHLSSSNEQFPNKHRIEGLQRLLYSTAKNDTPLSKFVEKLSWELESFIVEINKQFSFHEIEVFPIISKNCSHETQQHLLYVSLHIMPLGLLKCVITWFSTHLSEDECRSILNSIKQEDPLVDESFASLLQEWFRIGYSGKTSVEKFGEDLQKMFKSRCSFVSEQTNEAAGSSSSHSNTQPCEGSNSNLMEQICARKAKSYLSYSSSCVSQTARKYEASYSSIINLHIYFPETINTSHPFSEIFGGENHPGYVLTDPKPMDIVFFFHKALKNDLEYLVVGSAQLAENVGLLNDFHRRFHLIQFLFQIHSDAEDQVAFPALEEKGELTNISHSYTIDHKLEGEQFAKVSLILEEISELHASVSKSNSNMDMIMLRHYQLCMKLHNMCKSMHKLLSDHVHREEVELWPLFRERFSIQEQERIVGCILGRTKAEILQDIIPWVMASLTPEEQHTMMSLWRKVTRNTMFDEWLREWWEGYDMTKVVEDSNIASSWTADPLEVISTYLCEYNKQDGNFCSKSTELQDQKIDSPGSNAKPMGDCNADDKGKDSDFDQYDCNHLEHTSPYVESDKKRTQEIEPCQINQIPFSQASQKSKYCNCLLTMTQQDIEAAIRRVSHDSSLEPQRKSYIIQNLLMSRWIVRQHSHLSVSSNGQEFPGQKPSYRDPLKLSFGCKHYKRNCKLVAPCCNQLYTCIRCHDEITGHSLDRKSVTEMMCMKCLKIQPVGSTCSTPSCGKFSMARYYCRICKVFDDDRDIYHCPYCNLCRVGKGLGIDYYHCMNCNACMSRTLLVHVCREKSFMDNCPICHEDIFTSSSPVKALPCGHLMHSACFQDYTCISYTCPICGKSLGDMKVYFKMLDALLAEEKIPDEYAGQTKVILCHDCEKRGVSPFHWLYHKCPSCGSYNTRIL